MNSSIFSVSAVILAAAVSPVFAQNVSEPVPQNVPPLMTSATWESRRAEILKTFTECEYGVRPVERPADLKFETAPDRPCLGGKALCREVTISCKGPRAPFSFKAHAFLPKGAAKGSVPAFVYIYLGQSAKSEGYNPLADDPSTASFPATEIIARGYGAVVFSNYDVALDDPQKCFSSGVFAAFGPSLAERKPHDWGALSAWSWAASRCFDWLETQPEFNTKRIGVIGHSRGGKTALWAGVTDTRFAQACVNDSGCSGAKLNHIDLPKSEHIGFITKTFPHWFSPKYREFTEKDLDLPFDQHQLLALVAPRQVAVASATADAWAGPLGEFYAAQLASPAWEHYGKKGLIAPDGFPKPMTAIQQGSVSYQLREGKHALTAWDWNHYMDFLDKVK